MQLNISSDFLDKVLVLDFGGQYCHLIANRIRRLGVLAEIIDPDSELKNLEGVKALVLSGGPASVYDANSPKWNRKILSLGIPMLGICYGHQLLMQELGGKVEKGTKREYGIAELRIMRGNAAALQMAKGLSEKEQVWMSHGDVVSKLPEGFTAIGSTENCAVAMAMNPEKKILGLQFHPEVEHTKNGMKLLENFLELCGCRKEWNTDSYLEQKKKEIITKAGGKKVFLLASGGVDSTVCLAMLNSVLGKEKIVALHIDTGFMRKNESKKVKKALLAVGFDNLHVANASDYFFEKIKGVIEPEEKRKIIGNAFIEVQQEEMKKLGLNPEEWLLGQGTIYPDTIESGRTKNAEVIKTHHNRAPIIMEMLKQGKIIEPLDLLYKDEVRELGEKLGLPHELVWRHPFPGPGLAIRILCSNGKANGKEFEEISKAADKIAEASGLHAEALPVQSVGVQGDGRTFKHPAVLIGKADWKKLEAVSTAITNEISGINRALWLVKGKKDFKLQSASITKKRVALLQEADEIVFEETSRAGLWEKIWQFPVVLIPVGSESGKESIVLRPVFSRDAMTVQFADLPQEFLEMLAEKLLKIKGIENVFFDVTHKPPGTIEWE